MKATNISKSTMDKMGRGEQVSLKILDRICLSISIIVERRATMHKSLKKLGDAELELMCALIIPFFPARKRGLAW